MLQNGMKQRNHMGITTAQIRGARGILNWSQNDLAERTGISATSIGSIENGQTTPRASTLSNIQRTFETAGIEFIGTEGVRIRTGFVRIYTGADGLIEFYDNIYQTLKNFEGDVLVCNVDERKFVSALGDYAQVHINRMKELSDQIKYRILVREGDEYTPGSDYAEYRGLPKELFAAVPFYLYGDKLAIIQFDREVTIIVMNYPAVADAYRVQFADMWNRSIQFENKPVKLKA